MEFSVTVDSSRWFTPNKMLLRAARRAGSSAIRAARTQASREVRARKSLKASKVNKALRIRMPSGPQTLDSLEWRLVIDGRPLPVSAYPYRQTSRGVSVRVNKGSSKLIKSAFVATMKSGHTGVFRREGKDRLKIKELFTTRVTDLFTEPGPVSRITERAGTVFGSTFARNLSAA